MEQNVGAIERVITIGGGILPLVIGFTKMKGALGFLGGLWGADEFATGIVGLVSRMVLSGNLHCRRGGL
jgi:hypothetical protein